MNGGKMECQREGLRICSRAQFTKMSTMISLEADRPPTAVTVRRLRLRLLLFCALAVIDCGRPSIRVLCFICLSAIRNASQTCCWRPHIVEIARLAGKLVAMGEGRNNLPRRGACVRVCTIP